MRQIKRYRIIVAYDNHRVGDTIVPTGVLRDQLMARKWIEPVDEPAPQLVERAIVESETALSRDAGRDRGGRRR